MSGLYRTFKENYVPYFADGRGRDRYIVYNNAGFYHNYPKAMSPEYVYRTGTLFGTKIYYNKRIPDIKAPNFHYHADGNGRDKYILVNGGGLFTDSKPLNSYKLTDFLRKNDYAYNSPIKKNKIALSRAEMKYNKFLRNKEKEIINRLYTKEKKKFKKKFNIEPNNCFSDDEINKENEIDKKNKTSNYFLPKYNFKDNINNKEKEYKYFSPRHENNKNNLLINNSNSYKNLNENNTLNNNCFSANKLNSIKFKPKIYIDAKNCNDSNKNIKDIKKFASLTSDEFYNNMDKIKNYQILQNNNKNLINTRKQPYFHIINEQSI